MSDIEVESGNAQRVRRSELVRAAANKWSSQIIDLGGRNTLLFYKDLRAGTIDLTPSAVIDEESVAALLSGRTVRLSALGGLEQLPGLAKRARTVRAKATENFEERGLQTLFVAQGMATWTNARSDATPAAPVLLAPLQLTARGGAAEDFELAVADDWDLNPTLVHLLATDFQVTIDPDQVLGIEGGGRNALDRLAVLAGDVPGFTIAERTVVGNFSYAKQPLALDIQSAEEAMLAHPLVSAIAGDESALRELIDHQPVVEPSELSNAAPENEFLILDADASQSYVINAALRGANLVVQGPPGTGKSQTIANLIASLAADGKSVLFVAEKRAAIEAVVTRLERAGLRDLVLDLHGGTTSRRATLAELNRALEGFGTVPAVDVSGEQRRLVSSRLRLDGYADALHSVRQPFGLSVFEMQSMLLGQGEAKRSDLTLQRSTVERITWSDLDRLEQQLSEWVQLGGSELGHGVHPWEAGAGRVTSSEHAERALELAQALANDTVPTATRHLTLLLAECGLTRPTTVAEWAELLELLESVDALLQRYRPNLFALDLDNLQTDLSPADRHLPGRMMAATFNSRYRAAKRAVRDVALEQGRAKAMLADVRQALGVSQRWQGARSDEGLPRLPTGLSASGEAMSKLTTQLAAIGAFVGDGGASSDLEAVRSKMSALVADRPMLFRLPRLHELRESLESEGLGGVLDEVRARRADSDVARGLLRGIWLRSALDVVNIADQTIGSFDGHAQTNFVHEFQRSDSTHVSSGAGRVERRVAERAVNAMNEHVDQAQIVRQQAARKRGHRPLRELLQMAPDVLLAVKPCWAMSPLVVAQLLPSDKPLFDVVVFDEASQIPPAEAIPAILRGRSVVVAGDSRQLPPTSFFSSVSESDPAEDDDVMRVTDDMESILDSMVALLPPPHGSKSLAWHYRSKDERLIAFSNAQPTLYDWTMTTFPGVAGEDAISHVHVPWQPGLLDRDDSAADEVQAVVDLVSSHARERPNESLGLITMGIKHADRISEAIRINRNTDRALDDFCASHLEEPFFVKNLERVQGDERDAIILSIGYAKNADGRMMYRFGPLNQDGGERRLNVAITRARSRVTVVSSFTADDLDDARLHAEGAQMLKRYLSYAASHGTDFGTVAKTRPALNPFEQDVYRCLTNAGLSLTAQVGASGYWIDFAATHPDQPGRYVLAIEADGASYHSSATARDRDRLRQEHLERLGWVFHRIWSTDWFNHREREIQRALEAWEHAVRAQDEGGTSDDEKEADFLARGAAIERSPTPLRSGEQPRIFPGEPIASYSDEDLDVLVRWLRSDTLLRTDDELLDLAIRELGFKKRGKRIVAALEAAIRRTNDSPAGDRRSSSHVPDTRHLEAPAPGWEPPATRYRPPTDRSVDWKPDPTGRFEHRYWDGTSWTEHVARGGQSMTDPI